MAEPLPAKVKRTLWRGDTRPWTHVFTQTDENGDDVLDEAGNPVPVAHTRRGPRQRRATLPPSAACAYPTTVDTPEVKPWGSP